MGNGWAGSNRRDELPPDWPKLRVVQLKKDGYRCTWRLPSGARCPRKATDVDHYDDKDDHSKLRSLCAHHHLKRTSKQANDAKRPPRRPSIVSDEQPGRLR